jgi:hypothetical protein
MKIFKDDVMYNYPATPIATRIVGIFVHATAMLLILVVVSSIIGVIFVNINAVDVDNYEVSDGTYAFDNDKLNDMFLEFSSKNAAVVNTCIQTCILAFFYTAVSALQTPIPACGKR